MVDVKKVLGGECCATEAARNSHSPVVLRPAVGVVGALINAQLSSIFWSKIKKDEVPNLDEAPFTL